MAHPALIAAWAIEDCRTIGIGHTSHPCRRCKGRGFLWIKYFPCHKCAGSGFTLVDMKHSAERIELAIGILLQRIQDQARLVGLGSWEGREPSVHEQIRDGTRQRGEGS